MTPDQNTAYWHIVVTEYPTTGVADLIAERINSPRPLDWDHRPVEMKGEQ